MVTLGKFLIASNMTAVGLDLSQSAGGPSLKERGLIGKLGKDGVKVLGNGEIGHALTVKAARFTQSATDKIQAAGGTVEEV